MFKEINEYQRTIIYPYFYSMILRTVLLFSFFGFLMNMHAQSFQIGLSQGKQQLLPDSNQVIHLKRETFVIEVALDRLDGIFVNCSPDSIIWSGVQRSMIPEFETIGWKVTVETEFNTDQELFINHQDNYCYWFYDPKNYDWHRFDAQLISKGKTVMATKTISQFFDTEEKANKAFQIQKTPLYLTFFSIAGSFSKEDAKLDQVKTFVLIFED